MPTGGYSGYYGFEYQFYVTVLLAISAHSNSETGFKKIKVETEFGQDAEIEKGKSESLVISSIEKSQSIQIQVKTKLRNSQWSSGDIRNLLSKSDESGITKETVFDRLLASPNESFLFITDGILAPNLAELRTDSLISLNRPFEIQSIPDLEKSIVGRDKDFANYGNLNQIIKRFFIYSELSFDEVKNRIKLVLAQNYGIPLDEVDKASKKLVDVVRECALRIDDKDSITAEDIVVIVGQPNLESRFAEESKLFLEPKNFKIANRILEQEHVLLIVGEPAIGKSFLAHKIVHNYAQKKYLFLELAPNDAHLQIFDACRKENSVIVLLDDPFGIDGYNPIQGETFANQLTSLVQAIKMAKGRVKVVVTTRLNVIGEVVSKTKLSETVLKPIRLFADKPDSDFVIKILDTHLDYFGVSYNIKAIYKKIAQNFNDKFEDLLHARQFAFDLSKQEGSISDEQIGTIFNENRPSLYKKWFSKQDEKSKLYLIILLFILEVNQFAFDSDLKRIFNLINLPTGLFDDYSQVKENLLLANRIREVNNKLDFIHSTLRVAIKDIVETKTPINALSEIKIKLIESNIALDQSIAAYILGVYFDNLNSTSQDLEWLEQTKYIQVLDTFTRFGAKLLKHTNESIKRDAKQLIGKTYPVYECSLDAKGNLIIAKEEIIEGITILSAVDAMDILLEYELGGNFSDSENENFSQSYKASDYSNLDPIERYKFVLWLRSNDDKLDIDNVNVLRENLSLDPIGFVRIGLIKFSGGMFKDQKFHHILERLCYDNSPAVKREALEGGILRHWKNQPLEVQNKWLETIPSPIISWMQAQKLSE